jgi:hypothetical protein
MKCKHFVVFSYLSKKAKLFLLLEEISSLKTFGAKITYQRFLCTIN